MKLIFPICLALMACSHEEVTQEPPPKVHHEAPPPEPIPVSTNPFDKSTAPSVAHEPIVNSHWEPVGDFKMNDSWTLFTWKDSANHNICYFYTNGGTNGMSCIKQ